MVPKQVETHLTGVKMLKQGFLAVRFRDRVQFSVRRASPVVPLLLRRNAEPQVYAECAACSRFTFSSLFCARFIYFMFRIALIGVVTFLNSQTDVLNCVTAERGRSPVRTVNFHLLLTGDNNVGCVCLQQLQGRKALRPHTWFFYN